MLSALSFEKKYSLRELSAIKSLLSFVITVVSVMVFISNQFVVWSYALYMIIFSVIGGYIGARLTQLVNENFIKYFVKYPVSANVIMILIIIFGSMSLFNLRKTFFPERSAKIIFVNSVLPGASPLEIEQMVTLKIEDNIVLF